MRTKRNKGKDDKRHLMNVRCLFFADLSYKESLNRRPHIYTDSVSWKQGNNDVEEIVRSPVPVKKGFNPQTNTSRTRSDELMD